MLIGDHCLNYIQDSFITLSSNNAIKELHCCITLVGSFVGEIATQESIYPCIHLPICVVEVGYFKSAEIWFA